MSTCAPSPKTSDVLEVLSRKRLLRLADERGVEVDRHARAPELVEVLSEGTHAFLWVLERLTVAEWRRACAKLGREPAQLLAAAAPPATRADCVDGTRPCPWIACRYHLGADRERRRETDSELSPTTTCTLDFADRGGATRSDVGREFGLSRERIRQIETHAFETLRPEDRAVLGEFLKS